jgi:hypothetical protein
MLAAACGGGDPGITPPANPPVNPPVNPPTNPPPTGAPDAGMAGEPDASMNVEDAGMNQGPTIVQGGDVSGQWSGEVEVQGNVTVPAGQTLEILSGAIVRFTGNFALEVAGTLTLSGTSAVITFEGLGAWTGIRVANGGTLSGTGLAISNAQTCLQGQVGSTIDLSNSMFLECNGNGVMRLANGGRFRGINVLGGSTLSITGGVFDIEDSTIDFRFGEQAPDCTDWAGGTAIINHVRFTGCHCPLHFNRTDSPVMVTNSIFDNGANAVMIARTQGTFFHNHFITSSAEMLDIGGMISADIGGNYWGGGAPVVASGNQSQFSNRDQYETQPIPGVGPR